MIYELILGGAGGSDTLFGLLNVDRDDDELPYINEVLAGVAKYADELDGAIKPLLVDWTIERLAKVDLSILRLSCYEILHCPDIPTEVSIDEAVKLAQEYSTHEAGVFINGILGSFVAK